MIPPISTASPPAGAAFDHPAGPAAPPNGSADPGVAAFAATQPDARPAFGDRFGPPPSRPSVYADKNGSGGATHQSTKAADPLAGADVPGQKGVVVTRSFGDPKGYETKHHAVAWARAGGSERAMVVLGSDKRWHAVETNVVGADAAGGKGRIAAAMQVGKVDPARFAALRAEAEQAFKAGDTSKWKAFAAYALGLPESEIVVIGKGGTPSPGKVTINLSPDFDAEGRTAGFDPKQPAWIQLGRAAFDRPANAVATLAHEEVHASHRRMTGEMYAKYQATPHGRQSFRDWVAHQAKTMDGYRRADIVAGYEDGTNGPTELEAHVEAARVAFASGDLTQARTDLRKVATRPTLPTLHTQLPSIAALKELRDGLGADARAVFDEVVKSVGPNNILKSVK